MDAAQVQAASMSCVDWFRWLGVKSLLLVAVQIISMRTQLVQISILGMLFNSLAVLVPSHQGSSFSRYRLSLHARSSMPYGFEITMIFVLYAYNVMQL
jgi:hypothetical protein